MNYLHYKNNQLLDFVVSNICSLDLLKSKCRWGHDFWNWTSCILCHVNSLATNSLGLKTRNMKMVISYKTKNGTLAIKKHLEFEHPNVAYMYFKGVAL